MARQTLIGRVAAILAVAATVLLGACATPGHGLRQQLDETTGVTVTYSSPMLLVRDTPAYGAYARSFVELGALEINRMGSRRYFLWVNTWNTDRVATMAEHRDGFETVMLVVDGEPLSLDVHSWTPGAIGLSESVHPRLVIATADAFYAVTTNQLALIAGASDLWLRTSGADSREFHLWDRQEAALADLAAFVDYAVEP